MKVRRGVTNIATLAIASLLNAPGQAQATTTSFDLAADTVRGLASRNLSISVCLTGVILLQVRTWRPNRMNCAPADAPAARGGNRPAGITLKGRTKSHASLTNGPPQKTRQERHRRKAPSRRPRRRILNTIVIPRVTKCRSKSVVGRRRRTGSCPRARPWS